MPAPFKFDPCGSCCEEAVDCTNCDGELGPGTFVVNFTGIVDNGCAECGTYNDSFGATFLSGGSFCQWRYIFDSSPCSEVAMVRVLLSPDGGGYKLDAMLADALGTGKIVFRKTYASKPDCRALLEEDIPFLSETGTDCQTDSGTRSCKITAA